MIDLHTIADTALCLMMEHVEMEMNVAGSSPLADYTEFHGTASLRSYLMDDLAPLFEELWEKHTEGQDVYWCFDFDFVPRLFRRLTVDERTGEVCIDVTYTAKLIVEELNKEFA